jgi:hypothetical protein
VARQGAGAFSVTQAIPPNGSGGGSPSAGLSLSPATQQKAGTNRPFPSPCQPQQDGSWGLRWLIQFVQQSPKAAKPRGKFGPHHGHLCQSLSNRELFTAGPVGGAVRGLTVQTTGTPASSYPNGPLSWDSRVSAALRGQAEQVHGALCPHCPKITVFFFSFSLFFFFSHFFIFS